jgi:hypothetical protein
MRGVDHMVKDCSSSGHGSIVPAADAGAMVRNKGNATKSPIAKTATVVFPAPRGRTGAMSRLTRSPQVGLFVGQNAEELIVIQRRQGGTGQNDLTNPAR